MPNGVMSVQSATVQRVARYIDRNPGMSAVRIAEALHLSFPHVSKALTVARKARLAVLITIGGPQARWFPIRMEAEAKAMRDEARERLRMDRNARALESQALRRAGGELGELEAADEPIVQRVGVDARSPLPFVCRAPASVFHLGGVL